MSFKTEIEAIVGDIDSPDYTAQADLYLEEGLKYIFRMASLDDVMARRLTSSTTLNSSPTTMSTASALKIVSVTRNDGSRNRTAMEISPEDAGDYTDVNSIYYTSKLDPKYYIENGTLNVIPTPANGQSALVKHITPDTSIALGDSSIPNTPDELERGVILFACAQLLKLKLNGVTVPTVPSVVSLSLSSLGTLSTAPAYSKPAVGTNYGTLSGSDTTSGDETDFGVDDFIADEDPEMATVALEKQQQLVQQYAADIENELNEYNKELAIYTTDLQQKIEAAGKLTANETLKIQDYSARVESYTTELNAKIAEHDWYLQKYQQVVEELRDFLSIYMINFQMKEKDYETPANDRVS